VQAGMRVLDVACGPGTLTLLAAKRGARVDAIDFAPRMIDELRRRAPADLVTSRVGDGQELPFDDASYDAAFSMFGLMFFPDRARGFGELRRCLKDGGAAVVSSWHALDEKVPLIAGVFQTLREHLPDLPFGDAHAPLADAEIFESEMCAAGFREVVVHDVRHTIVFGDMAEAWGSMQRTLAPLALLSRRLGAAWPPLADKMLAGLHERLGQGAQVMTLPAWFGVGRG